MRGRPPTTYLAVLAPGVTGHNQIIEIQAFVKLSAAEVMDWNMTGAVREEEAVSTMVGPDHRSEPANIRASGGYR